jgi:hypothetical protein
VFCLAPQKNQLSIVRGACVNPFQSRDAIWHHTFNSVLMLQFLWGWKWLTLKIVAFFGMERVNPFQPPKIVAYEGQNKTYDVTWHHWAGKA